MYHNEGVKKGEDASLAEKVNMLEFDPAAFHLLSIGPFHTFCVLPIDLI